MCNIVWEAALGNLSLELFFRNPKLCRGPCFRNLLSELVVWSLLATSFSETLLGSLLCSGILVGNLAAQKLACGPCLEICCWQPGPNKTSASNLLGNLFSGALLANLFLGTLLEGRLGTCLSEPCLGTCSWEPCLGTCSWVPILRNRLFGALPDNLFLETFSWEPVLGNFACLLQTCSLGPCSGTCFS